MRARVEFSHGFHRVFVTKVKQLGVNVVGCLFLLLSLPQALQSTQYLYVGDTPTVYSYELPSNGTQPGSIHWQATLSGGVTEGVDFGTVGVNHYIYVSDSVGNVSAYLVPENSSAPSAAVWTLTPSPGNAANNVMISTSQSGSQYLYVASADGNLYAYLLPPGGGKPSTTPAWALNVSGAGFAVFGVDTAVVGGTQYLYASTGDTYLYAFVLPADGSVPQPPIGSSNPYVWNFQVGPSFSTTGIGVITLGGVQYLYLANLDGYMHVYLLPPNGTAPVPPGEWRILFNYPFDFAFATMPSGDQYLYVSNNANGDVIAYLLPPDGSQPSTDAWLVVPTGSGAFGLAVGSLGVPSLPGFSGCQTTQKFGITKDRVNILCWPYDSSVVEYKVYRDGVLIATLPGSATSYEDHNPPKGAQTYTLQGFTALGQSNTVTIIVGK